MKTPHEDSWEHCLLSNTRPVTWALIATLVGGWYMLDGDVERYIRITLATFGTLVGFSVLKLLHVFYMAIKAIAGERK